MHILLTNTQIINPDGMQKSASLAIDTRRRKFIDPATIHAPHIVDLADYMILPGLINAHDHLELNHYPRTKFRDIYPNAHLWGEDVSKRLGTSPFKELHAYPLPERCLIGGLKNVLAGVTTVAHHNPLHRPLKSRHFLVQVVKHYGWAHSLHFTDAVTIQANHRQSVPHPFMIHLAEGTDANALAELQQLAELGVLDNRTILIHGVGLQSDDIELAIACGASLVWCPSTNNYLLGQTAQVQRWFEVGRLMLGSDSRLTADGDLLDELRVAQATGQLTPQQLFQLVTGAPAKLLNLPKHGYLKPDFQADLLILPRQENPYEALIQTKRAEISLVMRRGKIILGDPSLVESFPHSTFAKVELDGRAKLMANHIAQTVRRRQLQEAGLKIL